ncbi:Protein cms1 [Grifola frondosa]|uniref:Protein cms1 n=1 Tax=Grifola frondosa TaxID=5627 RepID=A0A1C7MFK1_GRIFR|nr:Protein cms1 [Grifola frondosa]
MDLSEPPSVADQPPIMLADYLTSMQTKTFSKLSAIELADFQIPGRELHSRHDYVDGFEESGPAGRFHFEDASTLRTRWSALRVADVTRVLKDKRLRGEKGGDVAKLFAKHFKVEEHVAYLRRTKIAAAVGTPGRLGKLLCDTSALSTSALTHIILDVSHRDTKKRCVLDIPETRDEVFKTVLGAPKVLKGLKQGTIQLVLL